VDKGSRKCGHAGGLYDGLDRSGLYRSGGLPASGDGGSPDLATAEFDNINIFKPTPADQSGGVDYGASALLKWDPIVYPNGLPDWKVFFGTEPMI